MRSGIDFKRLRSAVEWSVRQLEGPRAQRVHTVRQYVGSHYGKDGSDKHVPTNMIELAITIYLRQLAARAPQVMVSTGVDELKPFAANMALAINQLPDELGLAKTFRRLTLEAMVGLGVAKVGLCESEHHVDGHDAGQPFVDVVSLDDYFVDMSAKTRGAIQYEGNDYWLDLDTARGMVDGHGGLEPDDHTVHGDQGEPRAEGVSADEGADMFRDKVWLRDVWIPRTRQVLTYGVKSHRILRVVDWDGPEHGPYYPLEYNDVPGNLLPLPPASLWLDIHELANVLFRKLGLQASAKKTVAAFQGGNDEDVERLKKAKDGEGIRYSGQPPAQITVGGIDAPTLAFFLQARDLFSYFAGNLDSMGGLSPVSDTGVQDRLVSEAAGARMDAMKSITTEFAKDIFKALAWYEWTDPVRERVIQKSVEGTDIVLERVWSEETREGDFLDFNLDIDPYSMEDDTPASRLQKIGQVWERFIIPAMPMIQAQGGSVDVRKLMEVLSKLANVDELRELIVFGEPIPGDPQQGGSGAPSFKPANTTRTYERVNRPGATRSGKDDAMSRILMGAGVQQSEAAAVGRPTS